MQSDNNIIIVGIKISDRLRDHLDTCKSVMKPFFNNNDPEYLRVLQIDNDDYIAKITNSGASLEELSNTCKNLKTMLKMICPNFTFYDDAIRIYAYTSVPHKAYY